MRLISGIRDGCFTIYKSSSDPLCFRSRIYLRNVVQLYLLLMLYVLRCREAVANDQPLVAAPEALASAICDVPSLADFLLSGNDERDRLQDNITHLRDAVLFYSDVPAPSGVIELNETTIEQALAMPRSSGTFMMVLFYAEWCPFSRELRPKYDLLSSLFPTINHVAVEGTNLRPSVLSKYRVHSYPLLFLYDKASREKYQGSRTLKDLVMFLKNATGVNPIVEENFIERQLASLPKFVTESHGDIDGFPFTQSLSPRKWLQNDTYLILATWFLVLRVLLPLLPWASSKVKRFWNRCYVHLFTNFKFPSFFKGKPSRRTFAVEITELKSRHFIRRWSKPLFS